MVEEGRGQVMQNVEYNIKRHQTWATKKEFCDISRRFTLCILFWHYYK